MALAKPRISNVRSANSSPCKSDWLGRIVWRSAAPKNNASNVLSMILLGCAKKCVLFDKIRHALTPGLCASCIPQDAGPFAASLGIHDLRIRCAEDHDTEWLGLHLRRVGPKTKGRPGFLLRATEKPPSLAQLLRVPTFRRRRSDAESARGVTIRGGPRLVSGDLACAAASLVFET